MATITASPNPVGVYSATNGAEATIQWNAQAGVGGGGFGEVVLSINGSTAMPVPNVAPAAGGTFKHIVKLPNTYTFIVRNFDTKAELARVDVSTYDLRSELAAGFGSPYRPELRPQIITNVKVRPGVDTVAISFDTVRPTIPLTTLFDSSGTKIDARFPLFGGLRTSHEAVFGVETPLALESKHSFEIVAAGATGNKSSPMEAIFNGEFVSGRRKLDIQFDTLDIINDGDPAPSGKGEFAFRFGAGDADTAAPMGEPWPDFGPQDISYDDPIVNLNKTISIAQGPRNLWIEVVATENDRTAWPWDWGSALGTRPTFTGAGSGYKATAAVENASVCIVIEIGSEPDSWSMDFEMRTGEFPVDYSVRGTLFAELEVGALITPKTIKIGGPLKPLGTVADAGTTMHIGSLGDTGCAEAFAVGADSALYHRSLTPDSPRDDNDWRRIELPGAGDIAVAASTDALDLVFRGTDGGVHHQRLDRRQPKSGRWRKLGGDFQNVVPAVGKDGAVSLFGMARDGALYVSDEGGNWDRLGDEQVTAIAPIPSDRGGAALLAATKAGGLLHFTKAGKRWKSRALAPLGGRSPVELITTASTSAADLRGKARPGELVIATLDEAHHVRALSWPDYPTGEPDQKWADLGPVQDLLLSKSSGPSRKSAPAKRAPARR